MAQPVLEVNNLTKQFGDFTAVDHVSFSVAEGEIVGLLGPNGAGKTTTIQMLLGLITPTIGEISYFGKPFPAEREYCLARIGFASAYAHLQQRMSVRHNLIIYCGLFNVPNPESRIAELVKLLGIEELLDRLYWKLSAGQQTRVNLVKALLNKPKLMLLDEPTASLDPDIARTVVDLIWELQEKEHVSMLYTSHNMAEVEELCDRVIFLSHGKLIAEDTPLGFTKRIGVSTLVLTFDAPKKQVAQYLDEQKVTYQFTREHVVEIKIADSDMPAVLFKLSKAGVWITEIDVQKPDLEDVFLAIAKGERYELAKS